MTFATDTTSANDPRDPMDNLPPWGPWMTGLAILRRDLFVTGREFPVFLAQVILQPLFLLFVFGKVLTELGYARPGYEQVLFPGLVALAAARLLPAGPRAGAPTRVRPAHRALTAARAG